MEKLPLYSASKQDLEFLLPIPTVAARHRRPSPGRWATTLVLCLIGTSVFFWRESGHAVVSSSSSSNVASWKATAALRGYRQFLSLSLDEHLSNALPFPRPPLSAKATEELMRHVPSPESARNASHSFTAAVHVAGTEGDRLSALLVKEQWESLLHLPITGETEGVFESGSPESKEALMGKPKGCHHRTGKRWQRNILRRFKRNFGEDKKWLPVWMREKLQRESKVLPPWMREKPRVYIDTYYPLLNYPVSHSLTLTPVNTSKPSFTAKLIEDALPEDPTSAAGRIQVPTFHGFAKNGSAAGQLVYAGKGSYADFTLLAAKGVDFKGKIALVQYGGSFRGLKVKAAAEAGCSAILIYTDPIEDGDVTIEAGYLPYPHGPARQPSSVQRGSVQFLSIYPGDPLTPFTPAYKNTTSRLPLDDPNLNTPTIPSFPISYEDAVPLLKSLNGKGKKMSDIGKDTKPKGWKEGGLEYLGVEYWTGPGEETVEMVNIMEGKVTPIWNTMAVIPGHIKDEVVVLGNHNDAWTFGAGDPNSGSATVHEIVKTFGILLEKGWKPLRTIVIASWDAEEYGLIGSTEFGEDFAEWLKENVVAYLNVDVGASGSAYGIGASPSLADVFRNVSALVPDPDEPSRSLLQRMADEGSEYDDDLKKKAVDGIQIPHVSALGSGSDFTVFLQFLGIASGNIGYSRKGSDPVYHYHSIYDSAYWMDHFGDPTFSRHAAIAKVLGLAALRLADSILLPINVTAYANELSLYIGKVRSLTLDLAADEQSLVDLASLDAAALLVQSSATSLQSEIAAVESALAKLHSPIPSRRRPCPVQVLKHARSINKRLQAFEGGFVTDEGLPLRPWYRSRVVAPGRYLGYGATTLPALTESLTLDGNVTMAKAEVQTLVGLFEKIAERLAPAK